ncbi:hypothetical protein [Kitasatospora sp. NPDC059599]
MADTTATPATETTPTPTPVAEAVASLGEPVWSTATLGDMAGSDKD